MARIYRSADSVWGRILACLAIVVIACGLKNYLAVIVIGTWLCPYLCPSVLPTELYFSFPVLETFFEAQRWVQEESQALIDRLVGDQWRLASNLLIAPVYEELVFRGPMFLTRRRAGNIWWWVAGIALSVVFALSHGRTGLALLPLVVLGICGVWLIATTGRFWPTLALHSLHNFFFSSALAYQSLLVGD
jgi:membrane protease YdiL (CAAX protease family)